MIPSVKRKLRRGVSMVYAGSREKDNSRKEKEQEKASNDIDAGRSLCRFSVGFNIPLSRSPGVIENFRQHLP